MFKIAFYALGCKSNQYETDMMKRICALEGFNVVPFDAAADIYIINTCTVTGAADEKSRHAIRQAKKKNKNSVVVVTGCYVEAGRDELYDIEGADILLKNKDKKNILNFLPKLKSHEEQPLPHQMIRAYLMVENGCENLCTYCIVPFVRGKITSKPLDQAVKEARQMVTDGVKEIVLTGINLGEYGKNTIKSQYHLDNLEFRSQAPDSTLVQLIDELTKIEGLLRIRLSSIEPMYINDELITIVKEDPKVCKHLHIPLQSGDDRILESMNRNYTARSFSDMAGKIKKQIKDIAITTDIIVGFPGEDEKAFANTRRIVDQIQFPRIHIFPYSDRPGTAAFGFKNKISDVIINKRYETLTGLRDKYMLKFHSSFKRRSMEVLVEQKDPKTGFYEGLTTNYIRVQIKGPTCLSADRQARQAGEDRLGRLVLAKVSAVGGSLPVRQADASSGNDFHEENVFAEPVLV